MTEISVQTDECLFRKKVIIDYVDNHVLGDTKQRFIDLINENQKLKQQIAYLTRTNNEILYLKYYEKMLITDYIKESNKPIDYEWQPVKQYKFITITFDPEKFGINNSPELEKQYILHKLAYLKKSDLCQSFYGCFEFHKSGSIHAHLIMCTNYDKEVYKYLKQQFTDNPRNRHAIDYCLAKVKAQQYIEKESDHYFISKTEKQIIDQILKPSVIVKENIDLDYGLNDTV